MVKKETTSETKRRTVFSERLRALYESLPYDRRDLSRRLGVPLSTLMQWEDGEAVPNGMQLRCVAMYFGLPCGFFLEVPAPGWWEGPLGNWQMADRLGLSECTVEKLEELAENAPGEVLDKLDDAIFSMAEAALAARRDWDEE